MERKVVVGLIFVILIIAITAGYFYHLYLSPSQQPKQLIGDEILEVKVLMDNGVPLGKIEVDLWLAGSEGIPNAGFSFTDDDGIVLFNIPEGKYEIGFNLNNFPKNLVFPERTFFLIEKGIPAYKTILISAKQEE